MAASSTLLIERYGFLGGMGTAAGVTNFCGLHANVHGEIRQVVHGVADDLLGRMRALGGLNEPHDSVRRQDRRAGLRQRGVQDRRRRTGAGQRRAAAVPCAGRRRGDAIADSEIDALLIETKSGRQAVRGTLFIDCSGDGDLAAHAGVPFEKGRAGTT